MIITEEALALLKRLGLLKNSTQFSIDYLGRSGRYFDYLRSAHAEPSIAALTTLAMRISRLADVLRGNPRCAGHAEIVDHLSDRLWVEIEQRTYADAWKATQRRPTRVVQGPSCSEAQPDSHSP